ncbi:MAG: hypothetical protein BWK80_13595 [Desulfobacteraceae bacterium IS3]|nr:MAG: hypothetical protein BWK80_13595 [Desulfobacteraceae bacterium IS3]
MVAWQEKLIVDFGANGLYLFYSAASWSGLAGWNPEAVEMTDIALNPGDVAMTHSAEGYTAGANLTVTNQIQYSGSLMALGLTVSLPEGWTYDSAGGDDKPAIAKQNGSALELAWLTPPANPIDFTYTVKVPSATVGQKQISATVIYRYWDDQEETSPNPITISPR